MTTRLSALEATALYTQTSTTPAHEVSVIVLDASERVSHDALGRWIAAGLPRSARFRSRLVGKPFDLGQPVWAEIDDFDPGPQIHRATVPAPGDGRDLAALVTKLTSGQQDWHRWLWEAWTIDGLAGGRWALAVKMSPVLSGASAVRDCLLTGAPGSGYRTPMEPGAGPPPSLGELVADTLSEMVENQLTGMWMLTDAVAGTWPAVRRGLAELAPPAGPASVSVFAAPLTKRRAMAFASIPMAEVKTVSDAFGGNTANVLLAACTLSLRAWLERHDAVPDEALLMEVPLSLPAGDPAEAGETVAMGRVRMPVHLDDPVQVLTDLHTATERLNIAHSGIGEDLDGAVDLASVVSLLPPWAIRMGARAYRKLGMSRLRATTCHGSVSFAAGPSGPAFCAGAEVVGMYTAEPMADGRGLNVTATSHADVMDLCLTACPDTVPWVDDIARGIGDALQLLLDAAGRSPRGEGRSVVTEMTSYTPKRSRRA